MEKISLDRWLSLVANLAVLIGIILLIVELDQNRDMLRSQTKSELAMGVVTLTLEIASNEQYADVLARGRAGEPLSPGQKLQFSNHSISMHRYWENVHYQYRFGLYDEVDFSRHKNAWRIIMNSDSPTVEVWCSRRSTFSPQYVAEIDSILEKYSCEP
jgi:hypothetical protein